MTESCQEIIKKEWKEAMGTDLKVIFINQEQSSALKSRKDQSVGRCYYIGRCEWWNPPEKMLFKKDSPCFCIKCWKWRKY